MKTKIIVFGIVSMFLLTGLTVASAVDANVQVNDDEGQLPDIVYRYRLLDWKWNKDESRYVPLFQIGISNIGKSFCFKEITTIYVALFIDNNDEPFHTFTFTKLCWPREYIQNIVYSEKYIYNDFPADFENHKITLIVDYDLHETGYGAVDEGSGENNNVEAFTIKELAGYIYGTIFRYDSSKDVKVRCVGIDVEFEEEIEPEEQKAQGRFTFRDIPFPAEYEVSLIADGEDKKSHPVQLTDKLRYKSTNFVMGESESKTLNRIPLQPLLIRFLDNNPHIFTILRYILNL